MACPNERDEAVENDSGVKGWGVNSRQVFYSFIDPHPDHLLSKYSWNIVKSL